jgi:hypothetical protein
MHLCTTGPSALGVDKELTPHHKNPACYKMLHRVLVNMVMNLQVPEKEGDFLTS